MQKSHKDWQAKGEVTVLLDYIKYLKFYIALLQSKKEIKDERKA